MPVALLGLPEPKAILNYRLAGLKPTLDQARLSPLQRWSWRHQAPRFARESQL